MARGLLREWHAYRREEAGAGAEAAPAAPPRGRDVLPARAKTMKTLFPRVQRELRRLLAAEAEASGGGGAGSGRGGGGWVNGGQGEDDDEGRGGW